MLVTPEMKNAIGLSILGAYLPAPPEGNYDELMTLIEDDDVSIFYLEPFEDWDAASFFLHIDNLLWDVIRSIEELEEPTLYTIRNDKEYLIDEGGEPLTFTLEEALSVTGHSSVEEAEESGINIEEEEESEYESSED